VSGAFWLTAGCRVCGCNPHALCRSKDPLQRDKEPLDADNTALCESPLCALPSVVALARTRYSRRIHPAAAALRGLLDRAYQAALDELVGIEDRRLHQVHAYLQLAREGKSVVSITRELGLHSRSYVQRQIQPQALELVTEAFLQLARQPNN
jgi:hypothetical protein